MNKLQKIQNLSRKLNEASEKLENMLVESMTTHSEFIWNSARDFAESHFFNNSDFSDPESSGEPTVYISYDGQEENEEVMEFLRYVKDDLKVGEDDGGIYYVVLDDILPNIEKKHQISADFKFEICQSFAKILNEYGIHAETVME